MTHVPPVVEESLCSLMLLRRLKLLSPTLTLMYSLIDMMARLNRPEGKGSADRSDFIAWVQRYILDLNPTMFPLAAIDLYAARCGWVHEHGFDSDLHRGGRAKLVCYAWGDADPWELNKLLILGGKSRNMTTVDLDLLVAAAMNGVCRFFSDCSSDSTKSAIVRRRMGMCPAHAVPEGKRHTLLDELSDKSVLGALNDVLAYRQSIRSKTW